MTSGWFLIPQSPRYLKNDRIFGEKGTEHKMCFDFFLQLLSEIFFILRKIQRCTTINAYKSACIEQVFLARF